jgi:hypothetical protein
MTDPLTADLRVTIAAGRFDRTDEAFDTWLHSARQGTDLMLLTEVNPRRQAQLKEEGWGLFRPEHRGAEECAVLWRQETWAPAPEVEPMALRMSKGFVRTKKGVARPRIWVLVTPLTHLASGRVVQFQICHMPSHVETPGGIRMSHRGVVWMQAVHRLGKLQRRTVRRHPDWAICLGADWNVDADRSWLRPLLHRILRLRQSWRGLTSEVGTLHKRRTEQLWTRGLLPKTVGVRDDHLAHKASDHRPVTFSLSLKDE